MPAQEVAVSSSESVKDVYQTKISLPNFGEVSKNLGDWADHSRRSLEQILSKPEIVEGLADLGTLFIIFLALPRFKEMGIDTIRMVKTFYEILAKYGNSHGE